MHERRVWLQPDLVTRVELVALAEHGDDLLATKLGEDLGLRAGRLDHDDLGFRAVVRDREVLGPDAVHRRPSFRSGWRRCQRQLHAVRALKTGDTVRLHLAFEEI